jgi:hypothetical protein
MSPTQVIPVVLVVSDDPAVRGRTRTAIANQARYIFECSVEDVPTLMRSVYVHTVVFIGERSEPVQIARVREALASSRPPARLLLVTSPDRVPAALAPVND